MRITRVLLKYTPYSRFTLDLLVTAALKHTVNLVKSIRNTRFLW